MSATADVKNRELTDSLLHMDLRRVVVGMICGVAAGLVLLGLSVAFTPPGANKLWWLQLMASICQKGDATAYDALSKALPIGLAVHFGLSILCGFIFGKITQTHSMGRLLFYGVVLGQLTWLASNMFGPNFLSVLALDEVAQWTRVVLFGGFSLSLAFFMGIASKVLDL